MGGSSSAIRKLGSAVIVALVWTSVPAVGGDADVVERGIARSVLDGATIRVEIDGRTETVRLIGVAALRDNSCLATGLRGLAAWLGEVELARDPALPDRTNGLLIRYVRNKGLDVSDEVIRDGLGFALEGHYERSVLYRGRQRLAKARGEGLWGEACAAARGAMQVEWAEVEDRAEAITTDGELREGSEEALRRLESAAEAPRKVPSEEPAPRRP